MSRRHGEDRTRSLAQLFGADAERIALVMLVAKGYWPLARHYRGAGGEIDMIMRRGRTIVAVEVKARDTIDEALEAIGPAQIRRIGSAFRTFRSERRLDEGHVFRLDAVLVAPRSMPRHIINLAELA